MNCTEALKTLALRGVRSIPGSLATEPSPLQHSRRCSGLKCNLNHTGTALLDQDPEPTAGRNGQGAAGSLLPEKTSFVFNKGIRGQAVALALQNWASGFYIDFTGADSIFPVSHCHVRCYR